MELIMFVCGYFLFANQLIILLAGNCPGNIDMETAIFTNILLELQVFKKVIWNVDIGFFSLNLLILGMLTTWRDEL